jgi:hypothetical protein
MRNPIPTIEVRLKVSAVGSDQAISSRVCAVDAVHGAGASFSRESASILPVACSVAEGSTVIVWSPGAVMGWPPAGITIAAIPIGTGVVPASNALALAAACHQLATVHRGPFRTNDLRRSVRTRRCSNIPQNSCGFHNEMKPILTNRYCGLLGQFYFRNQQTTSSIEIRTAAAWL